MPWNRDHPFPKNNVLNVPLYCFFMLPNTAKPGERQEYYGGENKTSNKQTEVKWASKLTVIIFYINCSIFTYSLSCEVWLSVKIIQDSGKPPWGWNSCMHSTLSDNCQNLMWPSSLAVASTDPSGDRAPSEIGWRSNLPNFTLICFFKRNFLR